MVDYKNYSRGRIRCDCPRAASMTRENCTGYTEVEQVPVMVYVVQQEWGNVYLPCRALAQGTLFPALDKPFFGKGGCCCD